VAAVASAMGLAGAALANDTNDTTKAQDDVSPALSTGSSASSRSSVAATIDAHTPPRAAASSAIPNDRAASGSSAESIGGNTSYDNRTGSAAESAATTSTDTTSHQTTNPAADLGSNAEVNGGAGIDNPDRSPLNENDRATGSRSTANDDTATNGEPSSDVNAQVDRNATQGSTMTSPKPNSAVDANAPGARSSATGSQGRFADSNSSNFNSWMSDYASQHNGRISRDEFMAQMGRRWDQRDTQHSGLTPVEVEEIFVLTPAAGTTSSGTGSGAQQDETAQGGAMEQGGVTEHGGATQ